MSLTPDVASAVAAQASSSAMTNGDGDANAAAVAAANASALHPHNGQMDGAAAAHAVPSPQQSLTLDLRFVLDNASVGGVIGKAGNSVREVREQTGVSLSIVKADYRHAQERIMILKGQPQQIALAAKCIATLTGVGAIIGKAGATIKCISSSLPLSTPEGVKTASSIKTGDFLVDENGQPTQVSSVQAGVSPTFLEITYAFGSHKVTPNHEVTLVSRANPCVYADTKLLVNAKYLYCVLTWIDANNPSVLTHKHWRWLTTGMPEPAPDVTEHPTQAAAVQAAYQEAVRLVDSGAYARATVIDALEITRKSACVRLWLFDADSAQAAKGLTFKVYREGQRTAGKILPRCFGTVASVKAYALWWLSTMEAAGEISPSRMGDLFECPADALEAGLTAAPSFRERVGLPVAAVVPSASLVGATFDSSSSAASSSASATNTAQQDDVQSIEDSEEDAGPADADDVDWNDEDEFVFAFKAAVLESEAEHKERVRSFLHAHSPAAASSSSASSTPASKVVVDTVLSFTHPKVQVLPPQKDRGYQGYTLTDAEKADVAAHFAAGTNVKEIVGLVKVGNPEVSFPSVIDYCKTLEGAASRGFGVYDRTKKGRWASKPTEVEGEVLVFLKAAICERATQKATVAAVSARFGAKAPSRDKVIAAFQRLKDEGVDMQAGAVEGAQLQAIRAVLAAAETAANGGAVCSTFNQRVTLVGTEFVWNTIKAGDQVDTLFMLHNPLTEHSLLNAQGKKALTIVKLEKAWMPYTQLFNGAAVAVTELNPVAAATGVIDSLDDEYEEVCRKSIVSALQMKPKVLVVFGRYARIRVLQQVTTGLVQGVASWELSEDGFGVSDILLKVDLADGHMVRVFFALHPSAYGARRSVAIATAAAFGAPFPSVEERVVAIRGITKVAGGQFVAFQVKGDTERFALADGIVTHNCTQSDTGARVQVSNETLPQSSEKTVTITGTSAQMYAVMLRIATQLLANPLKPNTKVYNYVPGNQLYAPAFAAQSMPPYAQQQQQPQQQQQQQPASQAIHLYAPQQQQQQQQQSALHQQAFGGGLIRPAAPAVLSTQKIAIPTICCGSIIGKGGAVIRDLRAQSGTGISISDPELSTPDERVVTLSGSPQGISHAVFLIRQLVEAYNPNPQIPQQGQQQLQQQQQQQQQQQPMY